MAATTFGSISFGMSAETGFYIESMSFDYSLDEKTIQDEQGEAVAGAFYKSKAEWSLDGAYKTTGSPSWVMGAILSIANVPTHAAFIPSYTSGGKVIVKSAKVSKGNEAEQRRSLSGTFWPFMAT
jgi:hypothetical protein